MLNTLRIRQLAIIDELELVLGPGLNVLTGETGAGKSILIGALDLVLGGKARPELVRTGAAQAEVEALFDIEGDTLIAERLEKAGIEAESELIVRRVVSNQGRSRIFVNGAMATQSQLAEIAVGLADVSSQHEHHALIDPSTHLDYLDAFGRVEALQLEVREAYRALDAADKAMAEAEKAIAGRGEREDLLRFQVSEIDALDLQLGELESLADERERLRHAERLMQAAASGEDALYARDASICGELAQLAHKLGDAAEIDSELNGPYQAVELARQQLEEAARDLGHYARNLSLDPERLNHVDDRIHAIQRIAKKYAPGVKEAIESAILEHRNRAFEELSSLDRAGDRIQELTKARAKALGSARGAALDLSAKRKEAATRLGDAITAELAALGMSGARIEMRVSPLESLKSTGFRELLIDGMRLTPSGVDRAEMLIAPNRGEEAKPLRKIASGGELSRTMLAIKRVLAGLRQLGAGTSQGLYVFDEVDTGVGGAIAEVIGQKLQDVSRHHQVLCITHSAPIAVYAERHFLVRKDVIEDRTRSSIRQLDERERVEEVARMLGGLNITDRTRDAARELMRGAR